jgi:hypothetical protein
MRRAQDNNVNSVGVLAVFILQVAALHWESLHWESLQVIQTLAQVHEETAALWSASKNFKLADLRSRWEPSVSFAL